MRCIYPSVSVIIVNYNGRRDLEDCLPSVVKQDYPNFEVILVDNNSIDDSIKFVKKNFPEVKIIKNKKNFGYTKGNNIGIKNSNAEYIIILNPDTIVEDNWLYQLVCSINRKNNVGACQSKILLYQNPMVLNTDGNNMNFLGIAWAGNHGKLDNKQSDNKEITYPSGCSMILRRKVLKEINLLDEDLFMYHDDLDIGLKLRLLGYDILCNPSSIVYHKYNSNRNEIKFFFLERNRLIILIEFYQLRTLFLILPIFLITESGIILFSLYKGWFLRKMESYFYLIKNLPHILFKRKMIQDSRIIGDKELLKFFKGEILSEELNNDLIKKILNPILESYYNFLMSIYDNNF